MGAKPPPIATADDAQGLDALLRSADLLLARRRPDLARGVLLKLLAVRADEPRALLRLGEIDLRSGRKDAALAQLAQLQASHPGSRELRELQALASLYASDARRLTRLQQLRDAGHRDEAAALARQVFPTGQAPGLWGRELADLLGQPAPSAAAASAPAPGAGAVRPPPVVAQPAIRRAPGVASPTPAPVASSPPAAPRSASRSKAMQDAKEAQSWGLLGQAHAQQGQYAAAQQAFDRADALDPSLARAWADARAVAAHWIGMDAAQQRVRAGELIAARDRLLPLVEAPDPVEGVEAPLLLAEVEARLGETATAQALYARVVRRAPQALRAWRGLTTLRLQTEAEAEGALDALANAGLGLRVGEALDSAALRERADALLASVMNEGHDGSTGDTANPSDPDGEDSPARIDPVALESARLRALGWLDRGQALRPADPWLRHDAARIELALGRHGAAAERMSEGRRLAPADTDAWQSSVLLALAADDPDQALALIARAPATLPRGAERLAPLRLSARFEQALTRVERLLDITPANRALASGTLTDPPPTAPPSTTQSSPPASKAAPSAFESRRRVALTAWLGQARSALDQVPERHLRLASALVRAGEQAQAAAVLDAVAPASLGPAELMRWAALLDGAGQGARAIAVLSERMLTEPTAAGASLSAAAEASDAGSPSLASRLTRQARLLRASLALDGGTVDTARADLDALDAQLAQGDSAAPERDAAGDAPNALLPWPLVDRLRLIDLQLRADLVHAAQRGLNRAAARWPGDAALHEKSARVRAAFDDPGGARAAWLAAARALGADEVADGAITWPESPQRSATELARLRRIRQAVDAIDASREPHVDLGWRQAERSGRPGSTRFNDQRLSVRLTSAADVGLLRGGEWSAHVEHIRLGGGTGLTAAASEAVFGHAVSLGWRGASDRVDLGWLDLPVPRLLGGWSHEIRLDDALRLGVDASRRALTNSRRALAGSTDPASANSDRLSGGATLNAVTLRASRPGLFGSLRVGSVSGLNLPDNPMQQAQIGIEQALLSGGNASTPDRPQLQIGLTLDASHHALNQDFDTFGHGGYASAQRLWRITVPIEARGRSGALHWSLSANTAYRWSHEADAPFYPTDPAAQAAAGNPLHGGSGPGWRGGLEGALRATVDWPIAPMWVLSGELGAARLRDEREAHVGLSLRRWFGRLPGSPSGRADRAGNPFDRDGAR